MVSHRETGLGSVFDPRRPSRDRARLVCDSTGASLVLHHDDGRLALVTCRNGAPCDSPRELSTEVGGFAAVRSEGATLVAWTGTEGDGAVRAATYGDTEVAARVIAACFADAEGFCGVPRIAERNRRILIATQEGGDLRVLETTDGGRTFAPMTGVR
jgi:hypothetical protein